MLVGWSGARLVSRSVGLCGCGSRLAPWPGCEAPSSGSCAASGTLRWMCQHIHFGASACTDVGGRVTDGAGSSVAVEWSDHARTVTLQPLPGWCGCVYKPGWLWPLRMAKRVSERATRGGERQSTEDIAFAHRAWISPCNRCEQGGLGFLALAGPEVRRLGDSAPRWPAGLPAQWPVAEAPDAGLRHVARSNHRTRPGGAFVWLV